VGAGIADKFRTNVIQVTVAGNKPWVSKSSRGFVPGFVNFVHDLILQTAFSSNTTLSRIEEG
jgi:hypothetical protein